MAIGLVAVAMAVALFAWSEHQSVVILWMTSPTGHADYYKLRSQLTRELTNRLVLERSWRLAADCRSAGR
jgi:hypothetical protein